MLGNPATRVSVAIYLEIHPYTTKISVDLRWQAVSVIRKCLQIAYNYETTIQCRRVHHSLAGNHQESSEFNVIRAFSEDRKVIADCLQPRRLHILPTSISYACRKASRIITIYSSIFGGALPMTCRSLTAKKTLYLDYDASVYHSLIENPIASCSSKCMAGKYLVAYDDIIRRYDLKIHIQATLSAGNIGREYQE